MQQTKAQAAPTFFMSEEEIAAFHRDGVAGPFKLLDQDEMKERWKRERPRLFDRSHAVYPDAEPGSGVYDYDRHLDNEFLAELVCRPEITHRLAGIMGPDVLCWRSEFFVKYPGDEATDWHQADHFGGASGIPHIRWPGSLGSKRSVSGGENGTMTAWIAFTDADEETSCMRFIPGTRHELHYDEIQGMTYEPDKTNQRVIAGEKRGFFGYDWRELKVDPNFEPDESKAFSAPCKAGEFMLFWSTTMHASHPHLGKGRPYRLAFAPRYVPTCVTIYEDMKETGTVTEFGGTFPLDRYGSVLVSGRNDYPNHRIAGRTTHGVPFVNHNPR